MKIIDLKEEIELLKGYRIVYKKAIKLNKNYCETIKSMRSEIRYALYSNKSDSVKKRYLKNAEREANEVLGD